MTGQDAINVIEGFNNKLNLTGSILTKLDGDTRGGAALSIRHLTSIPIKFIGVSEKMDGLEEFYPERMATRILGMGDIMSMVEKAESVIDEEEALKAAKKMQNGKFDLEDFLSQLNQIKKLGPLENLIKLIPGAKKMGLTSVKIDPKDMAPVLNLFTISEAGSTSSSGIPPSGSNTMSIRPRRACGLFFSSTTSTMSLNSLKRL